MENYVCAILGWGSVLVTTLYGIWFIVRGIVQQWKVATGRDEQRGFEVLPKNDDGPSVR